MNGRLVVALLLAAFAAGCTFPLRDPEPAPMPPPECAEIGRWWEPQLYPALGRVPNVTQTGPTEGVPFNTTRLRVAGPGAVLVLFAWRDGNDTLQLYARNGTRLAASFAPDTNETRALALLEAFSTDVTKDAFDADAAWADRREGNATRGAVLDVPFPHALQLEALWEQLDGEERSLHRYTDSGMRATWPGREARFVFPERRVETRAGDEPLVLYASGGGQARAMAPYMYPEDEAQSRVREAYVRLMLLSPRLDDWERTGRVCSV